MENAITLEEFVEIMSNDDYTSNFDIDDVYEGLLIFRKYLPDCKNLIVGTDHDIIYSVDIQDLIDANITRQDVHILRSMNWCKRDESYLAHFV